jgi:hypothetical protein
LKSDKSSSRHSKGRRARVRTSLLISSGQREWGKLHAEKNYMPVKRK